METKNLTANFENTISLIDFYIPTLLTRAEVAQYFGFSMRWLERTGGSQGFPMINIGGRNYRYRRDAIFAWIEAKHVVNDNVRKPGRPRKNADPKELEAQAIKAKMAEILAS